MNTKFWLEKPKKHTYDAAADYLELHYSKEVCKKMVNALRKERLTIKKAKDLLRASGLPLLSEDNIHVQENLKKVAAKEKLSPILVIRAPRTIIADGYHRLCSIYYLSEDLEIPCKIADLREY
jgi:hypothetical protein